jgi:hypothetical protein
MEIKPADVCTAGGIPFLPLYIFIIKRPKGTTAGNYMFSQCAHSRVAVVLFASENDKGKIS